MVFSSKHDLWLGVLILGLTGLVSLSTVVSVGITVTSIILLFVFGMSCWIWFGTFYRLHNGKIYITCGPFRRKITIDQIKRIQDTHNPLSAPACSLDRILLTGKGIYVLISPKEKQQFIHKLQEINPGIEYLTDQ